MSHNTWVVKLDSRVIWYGTFWTSSSRFGFSRGLSIDQLNHQSIESSISSDFSSGFSSDFSFSSFCLFRLSVWAYFDFKTLKTWIFSQKYYHHRVQKVRLPYKRHILSYIIPKDQKNQFLKNSNNQPIRTQHSWIGAYDIFRQISASLLCSLQVPRISHVFLFSIYFSRASITVKVVWLNFVVTWLENVKNEKYRTRYFN